MPVYSHSRLSVYETCPRQYKFQYVDRVKIPEGEEAIQLFLGTRVHEALERLYRDIRRGRLRTLDEVLRFYRRQWGREWPKRVRFPNPDDRPETYRTAGEAYLTEYYRQYSPFDQERTLAVERQVVFPLDDAGKVRVQGYIDRLSVTPRGVWEIRDYKTNQELPTQDDLDEDRQLALYQIGVQRAWPQARKVELVWHFLAHGMELRSRRTPEQIDAVRQDVLRLVRAIENDQHYPTVVGSHCDWCAYRPICPAWRHITETAELPPKKFRRDAGVRLVDRYAALKRREKALAAQIDTFQENIVAFADQEKLDAIRGTRYKVTLRRETVIRYPSKNDPDRTALEELIRRNGKWEEVSDLNFRVLAEVVEAGDWPRGLVASVRRFQEQDYVTRVWLGKLRLDDDDID